MYHHHGNHQTGVCCQRLDRRPYRKGQRAETAGTTGKGKKEGRKGKEETKLIKKYDMLFMKIKIRIMLST